MAGGTKGGDSLTRIHKVIAICGSSALLALTLTPAALAAGSARAGLGGTGSRAAVPNANIKGTPPHWTPTSLSAKAKWTGGTCTSAQVSFTVSNFENKAETITLTGTNGFHKSSGSVPAKTKAGVCITKGYAGTLKATLNDGKKLTVHF